MSLQLKLTPAQLLNLANGRLDQQRASIVDMINAPAREKGGRRKYNNERVTDGEVTFDSKAEHKRWLYLAALQKAREIRKLQRQVPYVLIPGQVTSSGKKWRETRYVADFVYELRDGTVVVEDVKGAVTPEFRIKRKLMLQVHGIEVREVKV